MATRAQIETAIKKLQAEFADPRVQAHLANVLARKLCPLCGAIAVVPLTPAQLAAQPDNTTHVCHPHLGGCNHGFGPARGAN